MDIIVWIIIIILLASLSQSSPKVRRISSEAYNKLATKMGIVILASIFSIMIGIFLFLFEQPLLGIFFVVAGIMGIVYFKGESPKLGKMYQKEEKKEIYQEELIKEKARLQARKEHKKRKV